MKRSSLVTVIAVALKKKGELESRLPTAIEEWLDGNKGLANCLMKMNGIFGDLFWM